MNLRGKTLAISVGLVCTILTWSSATCIAAANEKTESYDLFSTVSAKLESTPVDARNDRVWHAIPGLAGWKLNQAESKQATQRYKDGKLHLVWEAVPPRVRLSDLPAEPIYRGPSTEKSVSLMVNVSWGEEYLPSMLQTLAKSHVKATFFLDGAWVKKHPDLAKEIVKQGHSIGSHGSGHPDFVKLSDDRLVRQLDGTNQVIKDTLGVQVKYIAPPSGSYDNRLVKLAKSRHMYTILWTADTIDWRRPSASVIVSRVRTGMTPGALILMHPTRPTAEALPAILTMIHDRGYYTKTIDDVIAERTAFAPPSTFDEYS